MSVILTLPKIDIPTTLGWVHEASSWYIATDPSFSTSSLVASSIEDTINLTSKTLDVMLQPDVIYYSKVRIFCNKGIIESDLDITEVKDSIKITNTEAIPSIVNKPTLTLNYDEKDIPATLFNVTTTEINTSSNSVHTDSSYIIETLDGEVVYSKLKSKDNLTEKSFDDVILDDGRPYILRVSHESSSNDVSPFAEEIIVVKDTSEINVSSQLEDIDITNGLNVVLNPINDFNKADIELYATGMSDGEKVIFTTSITGLTTVIPESYFLSDNTNKYILKITITRNDNTTIGPKFNRITITK